MRFLVPIVLLAGVLVLASGAVLSSVTPAAAATTSTDLRLSSSEGRLGGGQVITHPEWFGGKWWKKFKRAMTRFIDFLDALIDDLRNHPGDDPGGVGAVIGISPALQPASLQVRQLLA